MRLKKDKTGKYKARHVEARFGGANSEAPDATPDTPTRAPILETAANICGLTSGIQLDIDRRAHMGSLGISPRREPGPQLIIGRRADFDSRGE